MLRRQSPKLVQIGSVTKKTSPSNHPASLVPCRTCLKRRIRFQKTDVTNELVEDLQVKTKEYLQPNPTARAKMIAVKGISKLSGQAKSNTYPQAEGVLADCMLIYGKRLGEESSLFGESTISGLYQLFDVV